jgi:hypothetical protein
MSDGLDPFDEYDDEDFSFQGRKNINKKGAERAKDEGMHEAGGGLGVNPDRAAEREEWRERLLEAVQQVCDDKDYFTSDDIYPLVCDELDEDQHTLKVLGSVMGRAARKGWCKKADCMPVNSKRVSCHATPLTVWESKRRF